MRTAQLDWDNHTPKSRDFGDIYFNRHKGLAESQYVFIEQNRLIDRFKAKQGRTPFTILETGFGTGLNFLLTWATFEKYAPSAQRLHFISTEKYPLNSKDLSYALKAFPSLQSLADQLLLNYPPLIEGFHTLNFEKGRIKLTLLLGDANETLPKLTGKVDAIYLDGFAPSKNEALWSDNIVNHLARLSTYETTLSTFTAATMVRRRLTAVGFEVQKVKGFAHKREMIRATFKKRNASLNDKCFAKWATPPLALQSNAQVVIIGAGLAGCALAYTLSHQGFHITLMEKADAIAQGASGNPAGLLMPSLSPDHNFADQFYTQGYLTTLRYILNAPDLLEHQDYCLKGLTQYAVIPRLQHWLKSLYKQDWPERLARLQENCIDYPTSGWVKPARLCQSFLQNAKTENLHLLTQTTVTELETTSQGVKIIYTADKRGTRKWLPADAVIIACGFESNQFCQSQSYPLYKSPGQLSELTLKSAFAQSKPLTAKSYLIPLTEHKLLLGASFRHDRNNLGVLEKDHTANLAGIENYLPELSPLLQPSNIAYIQGHVACRPTTTDHLPLIGPLANKENFEQTYRKLAQGGAAFKSPQATYLPHLYLCSGFGSKGMSSCLLSAEILSAQLTGSPLPISAQLYHGLHPSRFWFKAMGKKGSK